MFNFLKKKKKTVVTKNGSNTNTLSSCLRYEPNRNNRFAIGISSKILGIQEWWVRTLKHDNYHRMVMDVVEITSVCLPKLLDDAIEKKEEFNIVKTIMDITGCKCYSVEYSGCTVFDYEESPLDYKDDNIRTFRIIFDYKDYKYV